MPSTSVTLPLTDGGRLIGEVDGFLLAVGRDQPADRAAARTDRAAPRGQRARAPPDAARRPGLDRPGGGGRARNRHYLRSRAARADGRHSGGHSRAARTSRWSTPTCSRRGPVEEPAGFSAFVTARSSIDYIHKSQTGETGFGQCLGRADRSRPRRRDRRGNAGPVAAGPDRAGLPAPDLAAGL